MISRRDFARAAAVVAASGLGPLGRVAAQQRLTEDDILRFPRPGRVTLLHIADLHAQLTPGWFREPAVNLGVGAAKGKPPHLTDAAFRAHYGIPAGSADAYAFTAEDFSALAKTYGRMGGVDRIARLVKAVRGERGRDRVLLLDSGDSWQGSWSALKTKAQDMIDVAARLGVDAMTGHWEFTYGQERVRAAIESMDVAFLAHNVRSQEWQEPVFDARRMYERDGVLVAVIGQALPRTGVANPRWLFPDWEFGLREDDLQKEIDKARAERAEIVVLLSHNGFDVDRKLASRVRGLDVILSGHTHDALPQPEIEGSTLIVASGSNGKFLGRLDLDVEGGRVTGWRFKLMPVFADAIAPDEAMAAQVERARAPFAAALAEELGRTEELLYRRGNFNGTFDDLICDAMLAERDAEIALSPGLRWGGALPPGEAITFEALTGATAMTYPACYRMEMTGRQLKDVLEDVADNIFHPDPYFQSGGDMVRLGAVSYAIDVGQPIGRRISAMTHLKTGQPIEADRRYVVAGWASVNEGVEGPPIWDVVANYVRREKVVRIGERAAVKVSG